MPITKSHFLSNNYSDDNERYNTILYRSANDKSYEANKPCTCEYAGGEIEFSKKTHRRPFNNMEQAFSNHCQHIRSKSIKDWHDQNDTDVASAMIDCQTSEKTREETRNLKDEYLKNADENSKKTTRNLFERVNAVENQRRALERAIAELDNQIQHLRTTKDRLRKSLNTLQISKMIVKDCMEARARRLDSDLINDHVDLALTNELSEIQRAQDDLTASQDRIERALITCRDCKHKLERNWSDKTHTVAVDMETAQMTVHSHNAEQGRGLRAIHSGQTHMNTWCRQTEEHLACSDRILHEHRQLQKCISNQLEEITHSVLEAAQRTDAQLKQRIDEYVEAIKHLEQQLTAAVQEVGAQERSIDTLRSAVNAIQQQLALAQTRVRTRASRTESEETLDSAQCSLHGELLALDQQYHHLQQQLRQASTRLQLLFERHTALQLQTSVKRESLRVDKDKVFVTRTQLPAGSALLGF